MPGFFESDCRSPLDPFVREAAREMLLAALEKEVRLFLDCFEQAPLNGRTKPWVDEIGRRLDVRNEHLPIGEIVTSAMGWEDWV